MISSILLATFASSSSRQTCWPQQSAWAQAAGLRPPPAGGTRGRLPRYAGWNLRAWQATDHSFL